LNRGATLFLYTDGLNEAEDIDHQQFEMDRVMETAKAAGNNPHELIAAMSAAVAQFVGDAEQSDDLTMFAIQKK
jgi:sigma-B regulation protein RsbU (phosphoserine phosphatase)